MIGILVRTLVPALVTLCVSGGAAWSDTLGAVRPCPAPPDLKASDCLGSAIAADGGQVLASARGRDAGANRTGGIARWRAEGSSWVFDRWIESPRPAPGQEFGHSLSLYGDLLAVGAPADRCRGTAAGAAWVMGIGHDGETWCRQELVPPDPQPGERFGSVVATDGHRVTVTAPFASAGSTAHAGRVLVYEPSDQAFAAPQTLVSPVPTKDAFFGESLACDGECIVVGEPSATIDGSGCGSAYIYRRAAGQWVLTQTLSASMPTSGGRFAQSVGLQGDRLWIGEPRADGGGRVHFYQRTTVGFTLIRTLDAMPSSGDQDFGWSLACDGSRALCGAPLAQSGSVRSGRVHLMDAASDPPGTVALLGPLQAGDIDLAGTSVALRGTVLVFGAPGSFDTAFASGAVFAMDLQFDCDGDGTPDAIAIANGAADQNLDGVPDACACAGDLDGSGAVDTADISLLLMDFGPTDGPLATDLDGTGVVDTADLSLLLMMFGECTISGPRAASP